MASWCPWYPAMYFGSYTLYYAQLKNDAGVCQPQYGPLTGPNNLTCGCPGGNCIGVMSLLDSISKRLGLNLDLGDSVPVPPSFKDERKSFETQHTIVRSIGNRGVLKKPEFSADLSGVATAMGVTIAPMANLTFSHGNGGANPKYLAKVIKVTFNPAEFDTEAVIPAEVTEGVAYVGYVDSEDPPAGDPNGTIVERLGRFGWRVSYDPGGGAVEVAVVRAAPR